MLRGGGFIFFGWFFVVKLYCIVLFAVVLCISKLPKIFPADVNGQKRPDDCNGTIRGL